MRGWKEEEEKKGEGHIAVPAFQRHTQDATQLGFSWTLTKPQQRVARGAQL